METTVEEVFMESVVEEVMQEANSAESLGDIIDTMAGLEPIGSVVTAASDPTNFSKSMSKITNDDPIEREIKEKEVDDGLSYIDDEEEGE